MLQFRAVQLNSNPPRRSLKLSLDMVNRQPKLFTLPSRKLFLEVNFRLVSARPRSLRLPHRPCTPPFFRRQQRQCSLPPPFLPTATRKGMEEALFFQLASACLRLG